MKGEGEWTLTDVCRLFASSYNNKSDSCYNDFYNGLKNIPGIFYRGENKDLCFTGERNVICDLSVLPFPYPFLTDYEKLSDEQRNHKIYYYESSRGCPFSCSYCMSSIDRHVRFMPLERVFHDLQIFLDAGVSLVKFVDRTYNIDPDRYIAIWDYILNHHNGKTMFHFEIEAEYLSESAIEFLQKVPAGVMQFEIGVQSSNKKTLAAISRSTNIEKLAENVLRVPKTIHQHLDLIAGLPYEDLESFGRSFDFVMSLRPDALQLGFLKVLSGTVMESYAKSNGWKWMDSPVYETFSTPYMSYKDMLFLKDLEVAVDAYWNSGVFNHFMSFVLRKWNSSWKFFSDFTLWGEKKGVFDDARRETYWFQAMWEFINCDDNGNMAENEPCNIPADIDISVLYDLLRYDFILRGKQGNFPEWYNHIYDKDRHRGMLENEGGVINPRLAFGHSEYEVFNCDVQSDTPELFKGRYEKLIHYKSK